MMETTVTEDAVPEGAARVLWFLLEEPSMGRFLNGLLPRVLPDEVEFRVSAFNGKPDLLKNLEKRLRGLRNSLRPGDRIFVVVDRDCEDCRQLKERLEREAGRTGLVTRTASDGGAWQLVNRIVVEELEAWYFGDWEAVRAAYGRAPENVPRKSKYRCPDAIKGGTSEAFERVMKSEFRTGLRKREAAGKISKHIDPDRSSSPSFRIFYEAILESVARLRVSQRPRTGADRPL